MWLPLLIYAVVTILLALVDHIRRDKEMGKVANIDHKVSVRLAGLSFTALWLIFYVTNPFWWFVLYGTLFGVGCIGVRLLLYDIALALMNRQNPFKNSLTSSSKTEQYENKHHIGFWWQRGFGILGIAFYVIINLILK